MNIFRIVHCVKSWFTFSCFFPAPLVIPRICYQSALTLCSRNVVRQFQPHIKNGRILFCANLWPSYNRYDILLKNIYFHNLYIIRGKYFNLQIFLKFSKIALWNFPFFLSSPIVIIINMYELGKWSAFSTRNSDQNFVDISHETRCYQNSSRIPVEKNQMAMEFFNNSDRNCSLNGKNIGNWLFWNAFRLKLVNQLYFY